MTFSTKIGTALAAWAVIACLPGAALAADQAPGTALERCLHAVNILGASMGHEDVKDAQGQPAYRFILRTSGLEYEATCNAQTGIVGDVSPRSFGPTAPL